MWAQFKDGAYQISIGQNRAKDDIGNFSVDSGNLSGIGKDNYHVLAQHAKDYAGADGFLDTHDYAKMADDTYGKTDADSIKLRRAAIIMLQSPALLNLLDDGAKDGLATIKSITDHDQVAIDEKKDAAASAEEATEQDFKDNLGRISNVPCFDYMNKFGALYGEDGTNNYIGEKGFWGLAELAKHKDIFEKYNAGDTHGSDDAIEAYVKTVDVKNKGQFIDLIKDFRSKGDTASGPLSWIAAAYSVYYGENANLKVFLGDHHNAPRLQDMWNKSGY